jgi:hypothetical protein
MRSKRSKNQTKEVPAPRGAASTSLGVDGKLTTKSKVTWEPRLGFMSRSTIANFPHSLRSHSYYEKSVVQLGKKSGLFLDTDAAVERNF